MQAGALGRFQQSQNLGAGVTSSLAGMVIAVLGWGLSAYDVVTRVKASLSVLPSFTRGQISSLDLVSSSFLCILEGWK